MRRAEAPANGLRRCQFYRQFPDYLCILGEHTWMEAPAIIGFVQWLCLVYFLGLTATYLVLNALSFHYLIRYRSDRAIGSFPLKHSGLEPPISVLVPAYNEEATIAASVRSLLQLSYAEYEVIVVNDGSKDHTLDVLIREFSLVRSLLPVRNLIPTMSVRRVYRSTHYRHLRVIDKENGGKADALNAGINVSGYPLYCGIDADSILKRDSLRHAVQPFLEQPEVVACGGTIRVANGCEVSGGLLTNIGLPSHLLALFQVVEYLRAFLFGRIGWSAMNALLIISGAFAVFNKDTVVAVGGYRTDTVGEDFELVVRLHRYLRLQGKPYRITNVPDPLCWTEVPEDLKTLKAQRLRWQRGFAESLSKNLSLLFHPKGGVVGWVAFPVMVFFEGVGPLIEVCGYLLMILGFWSGLVSFQVLGPFFLMAIGSGLVLSFSGLLLEVLSFHMYPRPKQLAILIIVCLVENFGYRQLTAFWRVLGTYRWIRGGKAVWGDMKRTASWRSAK